MPTPTLPAAAPEPPANVELIQQIVKEAPQPKPPAPPAAMVKTPVPAQAKRPEPRSEIMEQPVAEVVPQKNLAAVRQTPPPAQPAPRPLDEDRTPAQGEPEPAAQPVFAVPEPPPVLVEAEPLYRNNPPPEYPSRARRRHLQGTVLLDLLVTAEGLVATVALHESSGHSLLDEAAKRAVIRWQFTPGTRNGVPIPMHVLVPVRFQLR